MLFSLVVLSFLDTLTKTKDDAMKMVGNSYGSLTKPRKMYTGKFMYSVL